MTRPRMQLISSHLLFGILTCSLQEECYSRYDRCTVHVSKGQIAVGSLNNGNELGL